MLKLLIVVVILVASAFLLLGLNIFFLKRKFPETEVGKNKNMNKLGLVCPKCEEKRKCRQFNDPHADNKHDKKSFN